MRNTDDRVNDCEIRLDNIDGVIKELRGDKKALEDDLQELKLDYDKLFEEVDALKKAFYRSNRPIK